MLFVETFGRDFGQARAGGNRVFRNGKCRDGRRSLRRFIARCNLRIDGGGRCRSSCFLSELFRLLQSGLAWFVGWRTTSSTGGARHLWTVDHRRRVHRVGLHHALRTTQTSVRGFVLLEHRNAFLHAHNLLLIVGHWQFVDILELLLDGSPLLGVRLIRRWVRRHHVRSHHSVHHRSAWGHVHSVHGRLTWGRSHSGCSHRSVLGMHLRVHLRMLLWWHLRRVGRNRRGRCTCGNDRFSRHLFRWVRWQRRSRKRGRRGRRRNRVNLLGTGRRSCGRCHLGSLHLSQCHRSHWIGDRRYRFTFSLLCVRNRRRLVRVVRVVNIIPLVVGIRCHTVQP
uniref:(northern house mosquito) hypothetical protein n=1 Tax=Culex pipiens TaxID=7175 RepID=A0A8D8EBS6_CULPI